MRKRLQQIQHNRNFGEGKEAAPGASKNGLGLHGWRLRPCKVGQLYNPSQPATSFQPPSPPSGDTPIHTAVWVSRGEKPPVDTPPANSPRVSTTTWVRPAAEAEKPQPETTSNHNVRMRRHTHAPPRDRSLSGRILTNRVTTAPSKRGVNPQIPLLGRPATSGLRTAGGGLRPVAYRPATSHVLAPNSHRPATHRPATSYVSETTSRRPATHRPATCHRPVNAPKPVGPRPSTQPNPGRRQKPKPARALTARPPAVGGALSVLVKALGRGGCGPLQRNRSAEIYVAQPARSSNQRGVLPLVSANSTHAGMADLYGGSIYGGSSTFVPGRSPQKTWSARSRLQGTGLSKQTYQEILHV